MRQNETPPRGGDSLVSVSSKRLVVELLRRYSSRPDLLERLQRATELAGQNQPFRPPAPLRPAFKLAQRLPAETVAELVAAYEASVPTTELTRRFNLGKGSVLKLLRQHGATIRHQPLTDAQITEAARLYRAGLSLQRVGLALGVATRTIHRALVTRGIPMRDTHGREKDGLGHPARPI